MIFQGFWDTLPRPIVGLSPMDGVTDTAMRYISKKYGQPAVMMTEFTSVEGVRAGALKLMDDFRYDQSQRPIVAQVFGADPQAFYQTAIVVCALGFDGIDINMGCPAKKVEERGAGAALIQNPKLAGQIIQAVKRGLQDWQEGISFEGAGVHPNIISYLESLSNPPRKLIPISIKTRIGYDKPLAQEWAEHLIEFEPATITMHGRTLEQLYSGVADWDQIGQAAKVVKATDILFLGNGDVKSLTEAKKKTKAYSLDGVLIGRAAQGNPWVFTGKQASPKEKLEVALEHTQKYVEFFPHRPFFPVRKHLAWYAHGFPSASQVRQRLVMTNNLTEVQAIIGSEKLLLNQ